MKILMTFIVALVAQCSLGQQYLLLNDLQRDYKVNKYTLKTQALYKVDKQIEIYNVFYKGLWGGYNYLCLISVLPDMNNDNSWEEIPKEVLENNLIKVDDIDKPNKNKFFNTFFLVRRENGIYYKAKNCLVEVFQLMNYPSKIHLNGNNIINIKQDVITYGDVKEEVDKGTHFWKEEAPMENKGVFMNEIFKYIYLLGTEKKDKDTAYLFWTFTDWHKASGLNAHRGIDRFAYIEGKGIVAGSYDFYFDNTPNPYIYDIYTINMRIQIGRKLMWAEELK